MEFHWHELIGRHVVDADGRRLGRLVDLIAEPSDDSLEIVALLVGRYGLLSRIGQRRWLHDTGTEVAWTRVREVTKSEIRLRPQPHGAVKVGDDE